jgi:hypothetical protein
MNAGALDDDAQTWMHTHEKMLNWNISAPRQVRGPSRALDANAALNGPNVCSRGVQARIDKRAGRTARRFRATAWDLSLLAARFQDLHATAGYRTQRLLTLPRRSQRGRAMFIPVFLAPYRHVHLIEELR